MNAYTPDNWTACSQVELSKLLLPLKDSLGSSDHNVGHICHEITPKPSCAKCRSSHVLSRTRRLLYILVVELVAVAADRETEEFVVQVVEVMAVVDIEAETRLETVEF